MRSLPEKLDLRQLKTRAKDLVKAVQAQEPEALARASVCFTSPISLAQAQLVVAREFGYSSWTDLLDEVHRRTLEGELSGAIDRGDLTEVQRLFSRHPHAGSLTMRWCNRGNPFVYAAQAGQLVIMRWLAEQGPADLQFALSRASMRYRPEVMRELISLGADPAGDYSANNEDYSVIESVAEALNPDGLRALVELGAPLRWTDRKGRAHSVPALLLEIYSRSATRKAACLEVCEEAGIALPDTDPMRIHRGTSQGVDVRAHYTREEIFPPELGCRAGHELTAAPIEGATALHLAVEFDDAPLASELLGMGADPNARTGPHGHSPLFHTAVTFGTSTEDLAQLLVRHGADPGLRATLSRLVYETEEAEPAHPREFVDVTAVEFGAYPWPSWLRNSRAVAYLQSL